MSEWTDQQIRYIEKCQERGNDAEVLACVRLIVQRLEAVAMPPEPAQQRKASEGSATRLTIKGLELTRGIDGYWLAFDSGRKKGAIHLENTFQHGILHDAVMQWAAAQTELDESLTDPAQQPALWRQAAWHRITWGCDRSDFLAWRPCESGAGIEVLAYNYATLQVPSGNGLFILFSAPSLKAIGAPAEAARLDGIQESFSGEELAQSIENHLSVFGSNVDCDCRFHRAIAIADKCENSDTGKNNLTQAIEKLCPGVHARNYPPWGKHPPVITYPITQPKMTQDEEDSIPPAEASGEPAPEPPAAPGDVVESGCPHHYSDAKNCVRCTPDIPPPALMKERRDIWEDYFKALRQSYPDNPTVLAVAKEVREMWRDDAEKLSSMTEANKPKLILELNRFRKQFGPVPLHDTYGEKWLIDKLLAASNWCEERMEAARDARDAEMGATLAEMLIDERKHDEAMRPEPAQEPPTAPGDVYFKNLGLHRDHPLIQQLEKECTSLRSELAALRHPPSSDLITAMIDAFHGGPNEERGAMTAAYQVVREAVLRERGMASLDAVEKAVFAVIHNYCVMDGYENKVVDEVLAHLIRQRQLQAQAQDGDITEKIRQVEEEISLIEYEIFLWPRYSASHPGIARILARLQAELCAIKGGRA